MYDTLVVKIASRGDLLLSAPAIRGLRKQSPRGNITLLVGSTCVDVARHLPDLDALITVDDSLLFSPSTTGRAIGAARLLSAMRQWHRRRREAGQTERLQVVLLHRDWRYAAVALLAGIPIRRGFGGPVADRLLTSAYAPSPREHHVSQYARVSGLSLETGDSGVGGTLDGGWRFAPNEREEGLARAVSLGFRPDGGAIALGFGGGKNVKTRTELKCWPVERYVELAAALAADGRQIVWLGDSEDRRAIESVDVGVQLAGELSVPETAAVVSACRAVVANDTFVMHLGEALGIPTVGLFGPTDPCHTGPLAPKSASLWVGDSVPCSPCHRDGFFPECRADHRCMRDLEVARVHRAVQSILGSGGDWFHVIIETHGRQIR